MTYLRHRWKTAPRHTVIGSLRLWVCDWVCVSRKLCEHYLKNQWREFHPILVTDVFGFCRFADYLLGSKVKDQGHCRQWGKNQMTTISSQIFELISPKLGHVCIWACNILTRSRGHGHERWTTPCLTNQWRQFHPIFATNVFGFIDVLIRFWGQKVKGQGHSKQWPKISGEYNIFVNIWANFTKITWRMYQGLGHID